MWTFFVLLWVGELGVPMWAERANPTPWHAHHIVERYQLMAIITLGEGVVGTVGTLSAAVQEHGWTTEAVLVVIVFVACTAHIRLRLREARLHSAPAHAATPVS